jgi:hypothetical protein
MSDAISFETTAPKTFAGCTERQIFTNKLETGEPWTREAANRHTQEHISLKQCLYDSEVAYEQAAIAFEEIDPEAFARCAVIDGVQYLCIRDLIMVVCKTKSNEASQIWQRISAGNKTQTNMYHSNFKFKGKGQHIQ